MRANIVTYTWKGTSGYSYGYVLITKSFSIDEIQNSKKPIILWGNGGINYGARCALASAGLNVSAFCDFTQDADTSTRYSNIMNYKSVIKEADKYYHIVHEADAYKLKEIVKFLQYAKITEFGILYQGFMKDFSERAVLQNTVYASINEVFSDIDFLGHWDELENCRRASLEGTGYWDVLFLQIYSQFKHAKGTKYLEVGPGIGTMSLSLKKVMDIDVTWVNIPNEEKLWSEWRRTSFNNILNKYDIKVIEGYIELDDFHQHDNTYDVVVLSQVMEHFIYNPVNSLVKLRDLLNDNGYLFISVPEEVKHYNVSHYSEMPYPDELTQEEKDTRCCINEFYHFQEYTYDEAMEAFTEAGLECVQHVWTGPVHNFMLQKKHVDNFSK